MINKRKSKISYFILYAIRLLRFPPRSTAIFFGDGSFFSYPLKDYKRIYKLHYFTRLLYYTAVQYYWDDTPRSKRLWLPRDQLNIEIKTTVCLKLHAKGPRSEQCKLWIISWGATHHFHTYSYLTLLVVLLESCSRFMKGTTIF